jgi:hypothetical protein
MRDRPVLPTRSGQQEARSVAPDGTGAADVGQ